jgi:predicted anti-sigma-YlaC factor YlaD
MWFLSSRNSACRAFEAQLEDLLEAGLEARPGARPNAALAAHLSSCPACREAFDAARESSSFVRQYAIRVPDALAGDPFFATRVSARIRENARRAGDFWPQLETVSLRLMAYAMSLAILLGALTASGVTRTSQPPVARTVSFESNPAPVNPDEVILAVLTSGQGR